MNIVSMINQIIKHQSADTEQIEKAGWALKQRMRKRMNQLSGSIFDEVDDFVLEPGQKAQFTAGSDYLSAMREIRAKKRVRRNFPRCRSFNMKRGNLQFDYFTGSVATGFVRLLRQAS